MHSQNSSSNKFSCDEQLKAATLQSLNRSNFTAPWIREVSASGQRHGPANYCILLLCGLPAKRDVLAGIHQLAPNLWPVQTLHNNAYNTERDTRFTSHPAALCLVRMCVLRHVSYRHKTHYCSYGFKSAVRHE